jgi:hypothetical protein
MALLGLPQSETSRTESSGDTESLWSPRSAETHNHGSTVPVGASEIRETQETVSWDLIPWMDDVVEKERTHPAMILLQAGAGLACGIALSYPIMRLVQWLAS